MLGGSDLVVLGLGGHAELPKLRVEFAHVFCNALRGGCVILIPEFLALRRRRAEERSSGVHKVLAPRELLLID
ncbi:hypothetical protein SDC9_212934 [bioreactor metagenome]|uniref:Uncharacterized protein n=1 Tax=bioreactor metagenome TaxID=1076179 RepID=A0A645JNC3_9ZZZZ